MAKKSDFKRKRVGSLVMMPFKWLYTKGNLLFTNCICYKQLVFTQSHAWNDSSMYFVAGLRPQSSSA